MKIYCGTLKGIKIIYRKLMFLTKLEYPFNFFFKMFFN